MHRYSEDDIHPGSRFGKLTVIRFDRKVGRKNYYLCECDCGERRLVYGYHLVSGHTRSCGNPSNRMHLQERFMLNVHIDQATGCWDWIGRKDIDGYGKIRAFGKQRQATHVSLFLLSGEWPDKDAVCHRCDNPPCVNPEHLFACTIPENNLDKVKKGRQAKGERVNTAKLSEAQVIDIYQKYHNGEGSQEKLAREYGVSQLLVSLIVRKKAWKHVLGDIEYGQV